MQPSIGHLAQFHWMDSNSCCITLEGGLCGPTLRPFVFKCHRDFYYENWTPTYTSRIVLSRALTWPTLMGMCCTISNHLPPLADLFPIIEDFSETLIEQEHELNSLWNCFFNQAGAKWQEMLIQNPILPCSSERDIFFHVPLFSPWVFLMIY